MRLSYHDVARQELVDIAQWYEHERTGLGERFADAYESVVTRILENPELFGLVGRHDRMADMKPFPYGIVFRVVGDVVRIKCVRHHSRHPRFGFGRK
jgi:plasmid stabilization system protein ParE